MNKETSNSTPSIFPPFEASMVCLEAFKFFARLEIFTGAVVLALSCPSAVSSLTLTSDISLPLFSSLDYNVANMYRKILSADKLH